MIIDKNPQGSEAWHKARAKAITASTFADAVSIVGGLTEQQKIYVDAIRVGKSDAEALAAAGYKAKPTADSVKKALAGEPVGEPSEASNQLAVLKAIGADVRYTELPGVPHNAWDPAYSRADVFEWLLKQKKR